MNQQAQLPNVHRRPKPALDPYLTVGEAAELLGVTSRKIRDEIAAGRLRAYQFGPRSTRIKLSDIEAALKPVDPIGGAA